MSGSDIGRAAGIQTAERPAVAWSFALFFCVFASWYVLRPLRDAMAIAGNTRDLPGLFLVTLGVTLAITPALGLLVSRVPRRRFLPVAYRILVVTLIGFFLVLRGPSPSALAARAFFVWASVLNLLEITLAWALMADVFSRVQGIRLFAIIGGGGTLGAVVGSLVTALLVERVGAPATLLVSAAFLECGVRCVGGVASSAPVCDLDDTAYADGGALRWVRRAVTSPFLLSVCAYLALFTFTSTVLYFEQAHIVKASLVDTASRTQLFARMDFAVNAFTLLLQLFVIGRALRFIGIGIALAALPAFTFGCFVALRFAPVLAVLVACQVARRTLDFALTKPAREVLFTVVRPEDKYKAKGFIDTFVYRSGDALAALSFEGVWGPALVGAMAIVCCFWAALGLALGRARGR
jgi:AAA family ATP:ADP antiporter